MVEGPAQAFGVFEGRGPAEDLARLPVAEPERLEAGLEPAGDEQARQFPLAPEDRLAERSRQADAGQGEPVRDRQADLPSAGPAEVRAQVSPDADVVAVDDVERLADGAGVIDRLREQVR